MSRFTDLFQSNDSEQTDSVSAESASDSNNIKSEPKEKKVVGKWKSRKKSI